MANRRKPSGAADLGGPGTLAWAGPNPASGTAADKPHWVLPARAGRGTRDTISEPQGVKRPGLLSFVFLSGMAAPSQSLCLNSELTTPWLRGSVAVK
jgi:hypothetical protein